jgi:amino-acid N-acetyltransferase
MVAEIRQAVTDDWHSIVKQLEIAGLPVKDLNSSHMSRFLVAQSSQGVLVGAIGLEQFGAQGLLRSLVVGENARGVGLGRELVARLEQFAADLGVTELWLLTIDADSFFRRIGFSIRDRDEVPYAVRSTSEFSELCPTSAFLMQKFLRLPPWPLDDNL